MDMLSHQRIMHELLTRPESLSSERDQIRHHWLCATVNLTRYHDWVMAVGHRQCCDNTPAPENAVILTVQCHILGASKYVQRLIRITT